MTTSDTASLVAFNIQAQAPLKLNSTDYMVVTIYGLGKINLFFRR